jgi:hypothetical protein
VRRALLAGCGSRERSSSKLTATRGDKSRNHGCVECKTRPVQNNPSVSLLGFLSLYFLNPLSRNSVMVLILPISWFTLPSARSSSSTYAETISFDKHLVCAVGGRPCHASYITSVFWDISAESPFHRETSACMTQIAKVKVSTET